MIDYLVVLVVLVAADPTKPVSETEGFCAIRFPGQSSRHLGAGTLVVRYWSLVDFVTTKW